jgi:hypothetical protein
MRNGRLTVVDELRLQELLLDVVWIEVSNLGVQRRLEGNPAEGRWPATKLFDGACSLFVA